MIAVHRLQPIAIRKTIAKPSRKLRKTHRFKSICKLMRMLAFYLMQPIAIRKISRTIMPLITFCFNPVKQTRNPIARLSTVKKNE